MKRYIDWFGVALACVIALAPAMSYAQQVPVPENKPEIVLRVTVEELNVISDGLQTQPFGKVVPLINKLQSQVIAQQPKQPVAPETPKE